MKVVVMEQKSVFRTQWHCGNRVHSQVAGFAVIATLTCLRSTTYRRVFGELLNSSVS